MPTWRTWPHSFVAGCAVASPPIGETVDLAIENLLSDRASEPITRFAACHSRESCPADSPPASGLALILTLKSLGSSPPRTFRALVMLTSASTARRVWPEDTPRELTNSQGKILLEALMVHATGLGRGRRPKLAATDASPRQERRTELRCSYGRTRSPRSTGYRGGARCGGPTGEAPHGRAGVW